MGGIPIGEAVFWTKVSKGGMAKSGKWSKSCLPWICHGEDVPTTELNIDPAAEGSGGK